ncbi:5-deoxy-glucuronate isomerase [Amycolatopsis pithecellobii]|uniref:5-deoxy-glucuronate isomerase n=1 Tax=Amycolatopsis pithecellobii TaxID=664692 RepID=UPI00140A5974|nr:5-deoxy-glucuronate isomerase [Amycolatopsis pithecellobii]
MSTKIVQLTTKDTGWKYLGVEVVSLAAGDRLDLDSPTHETAVVLVEGAVEVHGAGLDARIHRGSVFAEMAEIAYVPPKQRVTVAAVADSEIALGTAPAAGLHPARLVRRHEMASVVRGGGPAVRQVTSPLADPIPAESLIVYEAWVPRGGYAGWPPHRHDGADGSPYLEETYYFRFDRDVGFGWHRNFAADLDLDDSFSIRNRSLVAVPAGYHLCTAGPAANMWILNFLAGAPEDRAQPPCFDPAETWINEDWTRGQLPIPAVDPRK